jgi:hypothetical protein
MKGDTFEESADHRQGLLLREEPNPEALGQRVDPVDFERAPEKPRAVLSPADGLASTGAAARTYSDGEVHICSMQRFEQHWSSPVQC